MAVFKHLVIMGFEESLGSKPWDVKRCDSSLMELKSREVSSRHKRSKSVPDNKGQEVNLKRSTESAHRLKPVFKDIRVLNGCNELKKIPFPNIENQTSLKQEIVQLEKRLQGQFSERKALEGALDHKSSHDTSNKMPKPAKELIKEIAKLEVEVVHMEQYLLTLYRKAFQRQNSYTSPTRKDETLKSPPVTQKGMFPIVTGRVTTSKRHPSPVHSSQLLVPQDLPANPQAKHGVVSLTDKLLDNGVHRSYSSLDQRCALVPPDSSANPRMELGAGGLADNGVHRSYSTLDQRCAYSFRTPPPMDRSYYSQPLSYQDPQTATSGLISLAEHLGTQISDHIPETPTRIAEDMIRCIAAIYCRLSDPPLMHHGLSSSSPISSLSPVSAFSPLDQHDMWSPHGRKDYSFDARLDNPFNVEGLKVLSGPYSTMAEIPWICRDKQRLNDIDDMLQNYRLLVRRLEKVDVRRMKHEEKLAFWINIHNALAMHALLIYGIPPNNLKRVSLVLKAAYKIGGHTMSIDRIQNSILGCRMPQPVQWLRILLSPISKSKARYDRQYAIDHREPLLHFALCSGSHSDPAVRVYTPKRITQELETAKEEYIQATLGFRDVRKLLLPKTVESFAKDSGLSPTGLVEIIQHSVPDSLSRTLKSFQGKSRKSIDWIPHNFAFRFLLSNELVK